MGIEVQRDPKPANLAPMSTIARELGVGSDALKRTIGRAYQAGNVALAYTKTPEGALYDVDAVKLAAAPFLSELRERFSRYQAEEAERAAAHGKVVASQTKARGSATDTLSKPTPGQAGPIKRHTSPLPHSLGNPSPSRPAAPRRREPEVFIMRRRPVPTP
jgi:hypothetical protein